MTRMLQKLALSLLLTTLSAQVSAATQAAPHEETISQAAESAVVKVFATMRRPDLAHPWEKSSPVEATGSGVVIEGKRILTNAHVVAYASQVQVQGNQAGDKVLGHRGGVRARDRSGGAEARRRSVLRQPPAAAARQRAAADQGRRCWPTASRPAATTLSITRGIVSRIEFMAYNSPTSGLRIQIDAAINPGNSGGPALVNDKMIGLAFSHLANAAKHRLHHSRTRRSSCSSRTSRAATTTASPRMYDDAADAGESGAARAFSSSTSPCTA